jgi:prophage regulatory protein
MQVFKLIKTPEARGIFNHSKTTFYQKVKEGLLPSPVKLGSRSVVWLEQEIQQVAAARVAGFDDEKIKLVVKTLIEKRKSFAPILGATK